MGDACLVLFSAVMSFMQFISFHVCLFSDSLSKVELLHRKRKCDSRLRNHSHVWLSPQGGKAAEKNVVEEAGWLLVLALCGLGQTLLTPLGFNSSLK